VEWSAWWRELRSGARWVEWEEIVGAWPSFDRVPGYLLKDRGGDCLICGREEVGVPGFMGRPTLRQSSVFWRHD